MNNKVAILILGKRNAGKSSTFYELFGRVIRSGQKKLTIDNNDISLFIKNSSFEETGGSVENNVFVRNSSFEEYGDEADEYFDGDNLPKIVLCAVQYIEKGIRTIEYFQSKGYYLYIQWLNPGHKDGAEYDDYLGFEPKFSAHGEFHKVSGKEKKNRVRSIRQFLTHFIATNNSTQWKT